MACTRTCYGVKQYDFRVKQIVVKEGKVIVAVPNLDSFDSSYYKKYWAAYDLPIHMYHFSKKVSQTF